MLPRIKLLVVPVEVFLIVSLALVSLSAQQAPRSGAAEHVLWEFDTGG